MSTTVEATRPTTSQPARTERSGSSQFTRRKVVGYLVTLLTWVLVFLFFFPVLWMIITSFKTEGQAASFPPQFLFTPTLDRLRRRVRPRHGPVPAELVLRRGAVHRRRDAARHPGGVRLVGAADRPVAGRAVLLHLDQVHAGGRLDHPGLPAAALGQPAGQPVVTRPALPGRQPAACRLDDEVVLRRGADRRRRGRPDRRGQLQP